MTDAATPITRAQIENINADVFDNIDDLRSVMKKLINVALEMIAAGEPEIASEVLCVARGATAGRPEKATVQ
jgi:hypothetical protein